MIIHPPVVPYKVKNIPQEKVEAILIDLLECYQAKFGETWKQNLSKNLRPSPVKDLAQKHGVSIATIRLAKHVLIRIFRIFVEDEETIP